MKNEMKIYDWREVVGKKFLLGCEYFQEDELKGGIFVFVGAGILQRGHCNRNLSCPGGYDEFFTTMEGCEKHISSIEDMGYGNTISGPYPLFKRVINK